MINNQLESSSNLTQFGDITDSFHRYMKDYRDENELSDCGLIKRIFTKHFRTLRVRYGRVTQVISRHLDYKAYILIYSYT